MESSLCAPHTVWWDKLQSQTKFQQFKDINFNDWQHYTQSSKEQLFWYGCAFNATCLMLGLALSCSPRPCASGKTTLTPTRNSAVSGLDATRVCGHCPEHFGQMPDFN